MKKLILTLLVIVCTKLSMGQSMVIEMKYNINNIPYTALCVLYGEFGRCHVISSFGDCWYDARYYDYGAGRISLYNPSSRNWLPGDFYFYDKQSHWVCIQGQFFPIKSWRIRERDWDDIMDEYDFPKRRK